MKVTEIEIVAADYLVELSFKNTALKKPYIVKTILGLDADDIASKFYGSSFYEVDFYEQTLRKRDVVVVMEMNPDFSLGKTYSDLRDDVYRLIAASRTGQILLNFKNESVVMAQLRGSITKIESPQFTNNPQVQMTLSCLDPMLRAPTSTSLAVGALDEGFTTIEDSDSTAPHGFRFGVEFTAATPQFSVQDEVVQSWAFEVDLTGSPLTEFSAGEELHFSSERNSRYLYLVRDFEIVHLVDRVVSGSTWPILFPGTNHLVLSDHVSWDYIDYKKTYWGV